MKLPDENFADSNIVATDLVDDEIGIDNDFDETEFYFNQIVENFSEHLQINSGEHCIGKLKRSPVLILPDMTKISEGMVELIGNVTLRNVDGLKIFLRPESFRVSLSNLK